MVGPVGSADRPHRPALLTNTVQRMCVCIADTGNEIKVTNEK
ncbi:hypothetical protein HMPREF1861_00922 [Corynebacterium kroppenstedtii]|nr:hypothetical protein HMPREF1861_00922 [Corynebacterium kroppenstedtii]